MNAGQGNASSGDHRLDEVIAAYVQAVEAGEAPDRQALLARHLDLAAELAAFFADQDRFDRLAAPLRAMAPSMRREALRGETAAANAPAVPGTRVGYFGDYELLEEIARGGMGIVYKARQRSLNRVVALKMIRAAQVASEAEVRRFHTEAEAAANLDHPNIVPIYEEGEFQGQHYFSMKLIEGGNLAQRIGVRGQGSGVRDPQDQRADAALLAAVARAVHYAHERGLLHRDLKPANILLDAQGRPHVTDFGLAKRFRGDAGLTQSGAIVGTPSYMAPEQAAGHVRALTTSADVYSLGAILYELLTGRPPFRADTPLATLRQVTDLEPYRPRLVNPHVHRDLETICLKCLEKSPNRRYGSALELAEDLERFLADLSIRARRPALLERSWKWCRRHRLAGGLLCCLLGVVVVLLAFSVLLTARARQMAMLAREAAEHQRHEALRQHAQAETNYQKALQAVDEMLTQVGETQLAHVPRMDPVRQQLLESALKHYQEFIQEKGHDPEVREQTANAYLRMAVLEQRLGRGPRAEEAYRQAVALYRKLVADFPGRTAYQADLARGHYHLGTLLETGGRLREAEQAYHQALALDELLVLDDASVPDRPQALARDQAALGGLLAGTGRPAEAMAAYQKALASREKLAADFPAVAEHRAALATTYLHLARLQRTAGRAAEAEQAYRRALDLARKLVADFPTNTDYRRDLADGSADLAGLLLDSRRPAEAEAAGRQALALRQQLVADFPGVPDYRAGLARDYLQLSRLYRTVGRRAEAEQAVRQALAVLQKLVTDSPAVPDYRRQLAACSTSLGQLLAEGGRAAEAEAAYRQALALLERLAAEAPSVPDYAKERAATLEHLKRLRGETGKTKSGPK